MSFLITIFFLSKTIDLLTISPCNLTKNEKIFNDHCYKIAEPSGSITWTTSELFCTTYYHSIHGIVRPSHLATHNTYEENEWMINEYCRLGGFSWMFLGFSRVDLVSPYVWNDGTLLTSTYNHPNMYTRDKLCGELDCAAERWGDWDCDVSYTGMRGLCEYVIPKCDSILGTDSNVCNNHGNCLNDEICTCEENYDGTYCDEWNCSSVSRKSPLVCNGNGNCTIFNHCECNENFNTTGKECKKVINVVDDDDDDESGDFPYLIVGVISGSSVLVGIIICIFVVCVFVLISKKRKKSSSNDTIVNEELIENSIGSKKGMLKELKKEEKKLKEEEKKVKKEEERLKKAKKEEEKKAKKEEEKKAKKEEEMLKKQIKEEGRLSKKGGILNTKNWNSLNDETPDPVDELFHFQNLSKKINSSQDLQLIKYEKIKIVEDLETGFVGEYNNMIMFVEDFERMNQEQFNKFEESLKRFSKIKHSSLVVYYGYFEPPIKTYAQHVGCITDNYKGVTLDKYLKSKGKSMDIKTKFNIALDISEAMRKLHENSYKHGDLGLHNIAVAFKDDEDDLVGEKEIQVKVKFGINKVFKKGHENNIYSSPETIKKYFEEKEKKDDRKQTREDHKSKLKDYLKSKQKETPRDKIKSFPEDVFSYGIMLYELILMQHPYGGMKNFCKRVMNDENFTPRIGKSRKYLPNWYVNLMTQCFDHDRQKRPDFGRISSIIKSVTSSGE